MKYDNHECPPWLRRYLDSCRAPQAENMEPRRLQEWEVRALEVDDLHSEISHLQYCLREVLKCRRLSVAHQIARTALAEDTTDG